MNRDERSPPREPDPSKQDRGAFALILAKLGRRDHTEMELATALARKDFQIAAIESALDRARREGLVNDVRLARGIAQGASRIGKRGPRRVIATLRQKGISAEAAQAATKEAFATGCEGETNLVKFAGRLLERAKDDTLKGKRIRVLRSLMGRGFELSQAKTALRLAENAFMTQNRTNDADACPLDDE